MSPGNFLLIASGLLLYAWLIFLLQRRKLSRVFPLFFAYSVYGAIAELLRLFFASGHYQVYFYLFWWTELGFLILGIAALHEAFRFVFEGFYLLTWFRWMYYSGVAVVLAVSVVNSIFNRPVNVHPLMATILDLGIAINCIQAGIFGLFYLCIKLLKISPGRYPFAIVLGFGISAIGTLVPYVARSEFGKRFEFFIVYAPSVSYYISLAVWLSAFLRPEADEDEWKPPLSPQQMAEEVTQYTRLLKGFLGKSNES